VPRLVDMSKADESSVLWTDWRAKALGSKLLRPARGLKLLVEVKWYPTIAPKFCDAERLIANLFRLYLGRPDTNSQRSLPEIVEVKPQQWKVFRFMERGP